MPKRPADLALRPITEQDQSFLLRALLDEATAAGKPVSIHVEHNNPAMRLYLRLGFEKLEEQGVYHLMEWRPGQRSTDAG